MIADWLFEKVCMFALGGAVLTFACLLLVGLAQVYFFLMAMPLLHLVALVAFVFLVYQIGKFVHKMLGGGY